MLHQIVSSRFFRISLTSLFAFSITACGRTATFDGPPPEGAMTSTLAVRSESPAEIYDVSIDWVKLKHLHSEFELLAGTHTIAGKFETRESSCSESIRANCTGKYFYGDCVGAFTSEAGRHYTAIASANGTSATVAVVDTETNEKVGDASCAVKGSSYSAAVR